jgi:cell volume regulation protein A
MLAQQMLIGAVGGIGVGLAMSQWLRRAPIDAELEGLAALLLVAAGIATFAGIGWLGGSGFLAVYLFGLVVAHRAGAAVRTALSAMDGYAWLAQAGMFLLLGLLVTPSRLLPNLLPALAIAAVLMLIARPVAVWLCLKPLRFRDGEIAFVSWVGLRGAVPIVLAVFPVMAGVPDARLFFDIAFVVVLASLLMQGASIGWAARRCGVALPPQADEPAHRKAFGDFVLDPRMPMAALCEFYALPPPAPDAGSLGDWIQRHLGRPAVVGDACDWGPAHFAIRSMDGPRIVSIGLQIRGEDGELATPTSGTTADAAAAPARREA